MALCVTLNFFAMERGEEGTRKYIGLNCLGDGGQLKLTAEEHPSSKMPRYLEVAHEYQ